MVCSQMALALSTVPHFFSDRVGGTAYHPLIYFRLVPFRRDTHPALDLCLKLEIVRRGDGMCTSG